MMECEPPDLNPREGPTHPTTSPPPRCDRSPAPLTSSGPADTTPLGRPSPPPSPRAGPCPQPSGQTATNAQLASKLTSTDLNSTSSPSSGGGMKQLRWALSNILVLLISEKLARLVIFRTIYLNAGLFYTLEFSRSKGRLNMHAPALSAFKEPKLH